MKPSLIAKIILLLAVAAGVDAHELTALAGGSSALGAPDSSYQWQFDVRENPFRYAGGSLGWMNEGHLQNHHRDGVTGQLWARLPIGEWMSLEAGAGTYAYFDTVPSNGGSENLHGFAQLYSLSATYYTHERWLLRVLVNRIVPEHDTDSWTISAGFGFRLWRGDADRALAPAEPDPEASVSKTRAELTLSAGQTVVNTLHSENGVAETAEFRKGFASHGDWSVTVLNEGNPQVTQRFGIAPQGWLVDSYVQKRLRVGLGVGPYFFKDNDSLSGDDHDPDIAVLVTIMGSWRFTHRWFARLSWNRVIVRYDRDSDILTLGAGYRWGK